MNLIISTYIINISTYIRQDRNVFSFCWREILLLLRVSSFTKTEQNVLLVNWRREGEGENTTKNKRKAGDVRIPKTVAVFQFKLRINLQTLNRKTRWNAGFCLACLACLACFACFACLPACRSYLRCHRRFRFANLRQQQYAISLLPLGSVELFTSNKHAARKAPRISIYKRASERRRYEKERREGESIPLATTHAHDAAA